MPKRTDIRSILIIGSGPIVIGQACEFDYSGTQGCKALREEGYRVILVNSNPATIMTDPEFGDRTYIEPITPEVVASIIEKERPDALLPTLGGQTALNTAVALAESGVLDRYQVELIGAKLHAIKKAEDRDLFKQAMTRIGLEVPESGYAHSLEDALEIIQRVGYPAIIRPSFTLGGTGGNIAYNREEFEEFVQWGLNLSPVRQVLIEASVIGWKEFELEVMRDLNDNVVIICSIENFDPMGIHTGDSITVAPAQTLTDKEYQMMRDAAIAIIREIGVETGGSNIQFAVDPATGRMVVIEMNPRVSRSSALASKATGFPIAKIAAKLAVGYRLDEIRNDITRETPASFEPTIDYCVVKYPRWAFEKFPGADDTLTTQMKSVGEAMAIGRTFKEALQKAIRSLEIDAYGLETRIRDGQGGREALLKGIRDSLRIPKWDRVFHIADALRLGMDIEEIHALSKIDPWFLANIQQIVESEERLRHPEGGRGSLIRLFTAPVMREAKALGFSDRRLAQLVGSDELTIRDARKKMGIEATFKMVDTCAAEFVAYTPYLYSTYERECEANPTDRPKVVILGAGPNRIGQGIEFDYCCVHAVFALKEMGYETIMVNCNPETVSTDYDTADRLYFEPLTLEDVLNIVDKEKPVGVIVQFGGQTPLKLAVPLQKAGVKILGTSPDAIDRAEDRERFKQLLQKLGLNQPANGTAISFQQAALIARQIGYPVLVRPSYVLGGRAMEIVYDEDDLRNYMERAVQASPDHPILVDKFLEDAIEMDVDAISDGTDRGHRRDHGAHRRGRDPLGRLGLLAAAPLRGREPAERDPGTDRGHGAGAGRRGADQHPVCHQGQGGLRSGGEPAGVPHGALRQQGHRGAVGQAGRQGDAGSDPAGAGVHRGAAALPRRRQGSRPALRQVPQRGCGPGAGDEVHRRGDGDRCRLREGLCQIADRGQRAPPLERNDLPQRAGQGQAVRRESGRQARGVGLPAHRHRGDDGGDPAGGRPGRAGVQSDRPAPAPHRGQDEERRGGAGHQHARGPQRADGFLFHPESGGDHGHSLFHHHGGGVGRGRGDPLPPPARDGHPPPAGVPRPRLSSV